MGVHDVKNDDAATRATSTRRLLSDVAALERMLEEGLIEKGANRIGCEQEVVLVDRHWQAAPLAIQILHMLDDPRATTELARFNLEFNGSPQRFTGDCLSRMRSELSELLASAERAAGILGVRVLLTGILPTIQLSDLRIENLSPAPRYAALDALIKEMRGGSYRLQIKGLDELIVEHDNLLVEAINTSFQLHWQADPDRFALEYNAAQLISGPVLAACTNSPVLFGKRLWRETRIAIFQQTVDTRGQMHPDRDVVARVRFGERWLDRSVVEIFKSDIAQFRMLFACDETEDSQGTLDAGGVPKLKALQTHNSTVYRWNRPCYGVLDGKPHLRIENRYLPAGPTLEDEIANAALWFGLMAAVPDRYPDLAQRVAFDDVAQGFVSAARMGLAAEIAWLDGRAVPVRDLLLEELIPLAGEGLRAHAIDEGEIDRCLGLVAERVSTGRTGSQWTMNSVAQMQGQGTRAERLKCLAAGAYARSGSGRPVHEWDAAVLEESGAWQHNYRCVGQFMSTRLFTLREDEPIDLAASIMDWEHIRHIPVEDTDHHLIGLVSYRDLLRALARGRAASVLVGDIMVRDPVSVEPETTTLDLIALMREHQISCVPVVGPARQGGQRKLVGIVTDHDVMQVAGLLLERSLSDDDPGEPGP